MRAVPRDEERDVSRRERERERERERGGEIALSVLNFIRRSCAARVVSPVSSK